MTDDLSKITELGVSFRNSERVDCSGNACGEVKLKVISGYPNPPKARIRNNGSQDVIVRIHWANVLGSGVTEHELWSGETDDVDGPPQYWGVSRFEANRR